MNKKYFLDIACIALLAVGNLQAQVHITPIEDLNTNTPVINSHENDTGAKLLELNYREYYMVQIDCKATNSANPFNFAYSRIKKLPNGTYIMFWHINDVGSNILYSISSDLQNWAAPSQLFIPSATNNQTIMVQGVTTTDRITYNNCDALVLQNGDLMAVTAFRGNATLYRSNELDGISMRISHDNGQTWNAEQVIFRGMCWEPQILQLPSGEIQVYFTHSSTNDQLQIDNKLIDSNKDRLVASSGTAILRSFDNGATWTSHLPENEFYGQVVAQRFTRTDPAGATGFSVNRYTHQMPCAVQLNNSNTIALATEDQVANYSDNYNISISYSDDNWSHYASPNSVLGNVEETPAKVKLDAWQGAAPYLKQFPSGETVISYNVSNNFSVRLGDAQARTFTAPYVPFHYQGYWGALELDGSHTVIGTVTTTQVSATDPSNSRYILIGKMQLNHTIFPAKITPTIDGDNSDWVNSTDALFVGSNSQAQAAIRTGYDNDNLYLLVERLDYDLLPSDVINVYLHAGAGVLNSSSLKLEIGTGGVQKIYRYSGSVWVEAVAPEIQSKSLVLGTVSNSSDSDEGYIAEVAIPRSTIQAYGSSVKIALDLFNQDNGTAVIEDGLNGIILNQPDGWLKVDGMDPQTGISNPKADAVNIYLSKENLNIESGVSETISIYSANGVKIFVTNTQGVISIFRGGFPKGLLIVKGSSGWVKKVENY